MRMSEEARARYAQMESTVLLHHAGESLLRLWFAHKESSLCPWLAVASLTSARDFKIEAEKYANADTSHMTADDIASVFLGGRTPEEAGVAIPKESWEDSVNGFRELLRVVADQITGQANLYNAAKHGLVGIPADHGDVNLGDIRVAGGIGITYLQKKPNDPANHNSPRSWWATTSFPPSLATDLFLIELIIRAIHSLWNVARRKFAGFPGELVLISHDEVLTAKAIGPIADQRPVQDLSQKLPTYTDGSGPQRFAAVELSANAIRLGPEMLRAYERISGSSNEIASSTCRCAKQTGANRPRRGTSSSTSRPPTEVRKSERRRSARSQQRLKPSCSNGLTRNPPRQRTGRVFVSVPPLRADLKAGANEPGSNVRGGP